jgi:hypothetical protein
MRPSVHSDLRLRLLPEGQRWGFGAHSVVPYLTMALQGRPGDGLEPDAEIRNPVFPRMENALGALRKQH